MCLASSQPRTFRGCSRRGKQESATRILIWNLFRSALSAADATACDYLVYRVATEFEGVAQSRLSRLGSLCLRLRLACHACFLCARTRLSAFFAIFPAIAVARCDWPGSAFRSCSTSDLSERVESLSCVAWHAYTFFMMRPCPFRQFVRNHGFFPRFLFATAFVAR
jgi:hypothetical protein